MDESGGETDEDQGGSPQEGPPPIDVRTPIDGSAPECDDGQNLLEDLINVIVAATSLGLADVEIPEPGWTWVDSNARLRTVTGVVTRSQITHTDFPAAHDSHDQNTDVLVDLGQEDILSDVGKDSATDQRDPDTLEVEWEIGTLPGETGKNAPERFFPKWAWPNVGDRVWVNGNWIFDCGHPEAFPPPFGAAHYRTEIHPPRAIASMRQQARTLPGTGITPVPVTATDLYIHGRSGFVIESLICGPGVVFNPFQTCIESPHRGTPIDDDFEFLIRLPPRPSEQVALSAFVQDGPGNTLTGSALAPDFVLLPDTNATCLSMLPPMPSPKCVKVTIPLDGSGARKEDVYARQIYIGWVFPSDSLRHFQLTLNRMDLHEDQDLDPGDCECTFFWMNVDRSTDEWIRLSDFAQGNMNDYDDDNWFGDGEMDFSGAMFDFFVANGQDFTVRAHGYDQDCLDDLFGDHVLLDATVLGYIYCYFPLGPALFNYGDNDNYNTIHAVFGPPDYGVGNQDVPARSSGPFFGSEYELEFSIAELPVEDLERADLRVTKLCQPHDSVLAGTQVMECSVFVDNLGPGLPRNVVVEGTLLTDIDPSAYTFGVPTFAFNPTTGLLGNLEPEQHDCTVLPPDATTVKGQQFRCTLGSIPVNGRLVVLESVESDEPGAFDNEVVAYSTTTDPDVGNNQAIARLVFEPVADLSVDITDTPDPVVAGTELTYTVSMVNTGPSDVTDAHVVLTVGLPSEVTVVSLASNVDSSCIAGTPGDANNPLRCVLSGVPMLGTGLAVVSIVTEVRPDAAGLIRADASIASDAFSRFQFNDFDTEATTVVRLADLSVSGVDSIDPVVAGMTLTYTLAVVNDGPSTAASVRVEAVLPLAESFLRATLANWPGTCVLLDLPVNTVSCQLGSVPANTDSPIAIYIEVVVASDVAEGAEVETLVQVYSLTADPDGTNDAALVRTLVQTVADVRIESTSNCAVCVPPVVIVYTIHVFNTGPSDAQDVVVVDTLPLSPDTQPVNYVFDTGGCMLDSDTNILTCDLGTLSAGSELSFDIFIETVGGLGVILNTAEVTTGTSDPDLMNNRTVKAVYVGN